MSLSPKLIELSVTKIDWGIYEQKYLWRCQKNEICEHKSEKKNLGKIIENKPTVKVTV